ncbi:ribonuclease H family protein [Urbifossiella limnaea]|uniref:Ribonuclease HIII n=1 Tax=Urbifossiella limnaea TaxID=2528023 RepID=A0A517XYR5_9BACT|nr:hypothetical protein [Urbifossiella limnaea]QDU22631.1 Hypothetical protein ETAA1_46140 [Urbifossiella limnaea]
MPWVVGIDEAGYGPNLGPLVQAAVALHLPDDDPAGWDALKAVVRRAHEPADGRLLIDDSKKVYTAGGLAALERGVYPVFGCIPNVLGRFLDHTVPTDVADDLRAEPWFDPAQSLPALLEAGELEASAATWLRSMDVLQTNTWCGQAILTPATRFNRVVDAAGSKAAALAHGLVSLMPFHLTIGRRGVYCYPDAPVLFLCDKLGGRNFYASIVQQAFPDGWVVVEKEGAAESRYRVEGLDRPVSISFRPRADGDSVAVALASMLAKYLREVCMLQFNRFWATHVPGLAPTAGYPNDAKRYYDAIRPAMQKLGLAPDQVWRKR